MEQREGLLVSVILPAYNVANYLDDCLESAIFPDVYRHGDHHR